MKRVEKTGVRKPDWARIKKQAAGAAIGIVAAVSLAAGSLFGAPADVIAPETPAAVTVVTEDATGPLQPSDEKSCRGTRVRAWVLRLPVAVRLFVVLPLWFLGKVLALVLGALFQAASPLLPWLGGLLLSLLLVVGAAMLIFKLLFPGRPLGELFSKRNIIIMLACALALTLADRLLPLVWEAYADVAVWVKAALTLIIPIGLFFLIRGKRGKAKAAV